jgi:hypothetical protein
MSKAISFSEYLSQQEESTKNGNEILDKIDKKRISNFAGFGNKKSKSPNLKLINNYDVNYSLKNQNSNNHSENSKFQFCL